MDGAAGGRRRGFAAWVVFLLTASIRQVARSADTSTCVTSPEGSTGMDDPHRLAQDVP